MDFLGKTDTKTQTWENMDTLKLENMGTLKWGKYGYIKCEITST